MADPRRLSLLMAAIGLLSACGAEARDKPALPAGADTAMIDIACTGDVRQQWALSDEILDGDWGWRCRFKADNAAWGADHPAKAVFIGDSITEGWGKADPALFSDGTLNRGISAQTSPQLVVRFWQDVVALHPKVVHIMIGTNDIGGNTGLSSVADYQNAIRSMVTLAKANGIAVVIGSILPADHFNWRPEIKPAAQIVTLNQWLKDYAAAEGLVFADYHTAMATPAGALPKAYGEDGVHPNAAGYAVMRPIAEKALSDALAQNP